MHNLVISTLLALPLASHGAAAPYHAYTASLASMTTDQAISGEVTVFVTATGFIGIGSAKALEANLAAAPVGSDCTQTAACGVHIHAGDSCSAMGEAWGGGQYKSTDSTGAASFKFEVETSKRNIDGKVFAVHDNSGAAVACGILTYVEAISADLMPVPGSTAMGGVTVFSCSTPGSKMIVGAGWLKGMEASLTDASNGGSDCVARNGCGTHIHSGNSCEQYGQGGHLLTSTGHDPWQNISYGKTNPEGLSTFIFSVHSDITDVLGKPFIVHNNGGNRVACGLLSYLPMMTYAANISQIGTFGVSGHVTVFLTGNGLIGVGSLSGLESNLLTTDCTATNACGTHIHDGTACTDATTRGSHYFEGTDPWGAIKHMNTSSAGDASFSFKLRTSAKSIDGKPFVVHNKEGTQVACGILSHVVAHSAQLMPLTASDGYPSNVTGGVTVYTTPSLIAAAGWAGGLEANLVDTACSATNGCGTHVHSGTSCATSAQQGGHLTTSAGQDPWTNISYSSTDAHGYATVMFSVSSDRSDVLGKPFIVHDSEGARVSCGLLSDVTTTTTTPFMPSHEVYKVYAATMTPRLGSNVSGKIVIFVTKTGLIGIGSADGLEPNLIASPNGNNCTVANACGTHVHGGTACTDENTQGTHDYDDAGSDPWRVIKFPSTDSTGHAEYTFELKTSAVILDRKPFMLHDNQGRRISCGILSRVDTHSAELTALNNSGVTGSVTMFASPEMMYGAGWAHGVDKDLSKPDGDCTAKNGCGAHVHSGTSCDQASQGGHLVASADIVDPWKDIGYKSSNADGYATFVFSVKAASAGAFVLPKPFIVHNNAGARVSCGLISSDATTSLPAASTSETPGTVSTSPTAESEGNGTTTGGPGGVVSGASPITNQVLAGIPILVMMMQ